MNPNSYNRELLNITDDERVSVLNKIKAAHGALSYLYELLENKTATISTRHDTLGIVRFNFQEIENILGASEDVEQYEETKKNMLREAYEQIAKLNNELANKNSVQWIGPKVEQLSRTISNWWQNQGFDYCSCKLSFGPMGATFLVDFNASIEYLASRFSETPVTEQNKINENKTNLRKSLNLIDVPGDSVVVVDNQKNRKWIKNLLRKKFPNCKINSWENISMHNMDNFKLTRIKVYIDLNEIGGFVELDKDLR